jgi:histidyl-tRNA synthetase
MKTVIQPVKGTRDFYPREMGVRGWLYQNMRAVSEAFGYTEYEGPILETIDLYASKSGDELVRKQAFVFNDRGGDAVTLRPELTPTLARMVAQRQGELVFPLRWWSFGPFWRYEQPQKGRAREFFQWNVDLIGAESPEADAELVAVVATFLARVGLSPSEVAIRVNDRRLMDAQLEALGVPVGQRPEVSNLIDRRDKLTPDHWRENARELGLDAARFDRLVALLDDPELWRKSESLVRVFDACRALGIAPYVRYDANVVRGLLYYTGTVFEAFDLTGDVRRAILGGGRYDNLLAAVGGQPTPGVGFAMGDVIIGLILERLGRLPDTVGRGPAEVLLTVFDAETRRASLELAAELRAAGLKVALFPDVAKLPRQFRYADRIGAPAVVVLGPDEVARGTATVKDLRRGNQVTVARAEVAATVRAIVGDG